ncbi:MAG: hypothetical protein D6771_05185, partial [Zetaproteobacteria bacterium]
MIVIYVSQHAEIVGGGERSVLEILQYLPSDVEARLVLPQKGPMQRLARAIGVDVDLVPMPPLGVRTLAAIGPWRRYLRQYPHAIVHANHARAAVYAWLGGARRLVFHARVAAQDRLDGLLLRVCDAIVCNSHATARARFPEGHPKVHVIYNGVPAPRLKAPVKRRARLVWVGRWDAIKRPELAVELFEHLAPHWHGELVIAGGAPPGSSYRDQLTARVVQSPVRARIKLCGPTARTGELLASARFALVTSMHEGFGRVAV